MTVRIDIPDIPGHERECNQIRTMACAELAEPDEFVESGDAQALKNLTELRLTLADLGCTLFTEKRFDEAERVFLLTLDNNLHTQPTFDRLIKIYEMRKDVEQLNALLGRKELAMFNFRGANYMADRIKAKLAALRCEPTGRTSKRKGNTDRQPR